MHTPAYTPSTNNSIRSDPSSPSIRNSMKRDRNFDNELVDDSEISLMFLSHPLSSLNTSTASTGIQMHDNVINNSVAAAVASALLHKKTASSSSILDGNITDNDRYNSRSPKLPKTRNTQNQRKTSEMSLTSILSRANMLDSPSSSSQTNDQSNSGNNNNGNRRNGNTSGNGNGDNDGDDSSSSRDDEDAQSLSSTTQLWTIEEDRLLLRKQEEIGNKWAHIVKFLPPRNQNHLKVRFKSILRAAKREWTEKENTLLIKLYIDYKADFSAIAPFFPHRTKNAVKKHHRSLVKMKKDNICPLPPPHGAPNQIFFEKEVLHNQIRQLAETMLPTQNKDEKPGTSPLMNPLDANNTQSTLSRFNPSPVYHIQSPNPDSKNLSTVKARNASSGSQQILFQQQQQQQQHFQQQQQNMQYQQQQAQVQQPNWAPNIYNSQQQHNGVGMPVSNLLGSSFMGGLLHTDSYLDTGHIAARPNLPLATTAPSTPANAVQHHQQQQQIQNTAAPTSPFTFRSPLKAKRNSKQAIVPASLKQDKFAATPDEKRAVTQPGMHPSDQSHHVHHTHQPMYNNLHAQNLYMNNYQPNQHQQQMYQHQQQINQQQQQQYHFAMQQAPQQQQLYPPIHQQHQPNQGSDLLDDWFVGTDFLLDENECKTLFGNP